MLEIEIKIESFTKYCLMLFIAHEFVFKAYEKCGITERFNKDAVYIVTLPMKCLFS